MKITEPGIYFDFQIADYFADPCPEPSLTQTIAKILLERSPLHAWHAHPMLNPDYRPDDDTKFDIGSVAHKLLIGRGKDIVALEQFEDWRTKASQEARAKAVAEGKLAVLGKQYARAQNMVAAALEQLALRGLGDWFCEGAGHGEVVLACQDNGIWLRQMIDWKNHTAVIDYKTTDMSVAPHCLGRMMATAGWDIQGAQAERILGVLGKERHDYLFVVQETTVPYCLSVVELSESALTMGRKKLFAAITIWRDCMRADRWPGYPTEIVVPEYPGWAESQWLDREQTEFASDRPRGADLIMAG